MEAARTEEEKGMADGQIIRKKIEKKNIAEAKPYVGRLKVYGNIKFVYYEDNPGLINCNF